MIGIMKSMEMKAVCRGDTANNRVSMKIRVEETEDEDCLSWIAVWLSSIVIETLTFLSIGEFYMKKNTSNVVPHKLQDLFEGKGSATIIANNQIVHDFAEYLLNLKSPTIISVNYETEYEQSTYTMLIGVNMENLYRKHIRICQELKRSMKYRGVEFIEALDNIIKSRENSLAKGIGNNDAYTLKGKYTHIEGENSSMKVNNDSGVVVLQGVLIRKVVNVKFKDKEYKPSKNPVVNAQNIIKSKELDKILTLKVDVSNIHAVSYNKNKLSIINDDKIISLKKMQKSLGRPLTREERDAIYS